MTFNVIASNQYSSTSSTQHSRTHNLTGSFLKNDIAIVFTMPNGPSLTSTYNYGSPTGWTAVFDPTSTNNSIHYAYYVLPENQTNFSATFYSHYGSFCAIVRGYVVSEGFKGTLPISRTLNAGDVILLPGGSADASYTQWGLGYDTTPSYSGSYREVTASGSVTIPDVSQYSRSNPYKTALILNVPAPQPTGLTVTNSPLSLGESVNASWTDTLSGQQTKYQMRWRRSD